MQINDVVKEIAQFVEISAKDAQVQIDLSLGDLPETMADRIRSASWC